MNNKKTHNITKISLPFSTLLFTTLMILFDKGPYMIITLLSAFAHELGHIIAAKLCGVRILKITLYPFGADIKLDSPLRSYQKDIFISSAGVTVNFFIIISAMLLPYTRYTDIIAACNLTLLITNIFPIDGLDGGGILKGLLSVLISPQKADKIILITTFLGLFIMWTASIYIFFVKQGNPSLFIISCTLFVSIFIVNNYKGKTE